MGERVISACVLPFVMFLLAWLVLFVVYLIPKFSLSHPYIVYYGFMIPLHLLLTPDVIQKSSSPIRLLSYSPPVQKYTQHLNKPSW